MLHPGSARAEDLTGSLGWNAAETAAAAMFAVRTSPEGVSEPCRITWRAAHYSTAQIHVEREAG